MACGGNAAPGATVAIPTAQSTAVPTVVASATSDVATLTERVEDALALASRGNWLEAWEYYTLSFRESCPKETFAAQAAFGLSYLQSLIGLPLTTLGVPVDGRIGGRAHGPGRYPDIPLGRPFGIRGA